jgi:hypothetical protein
MQTLKFCSYLLHPSLCWSLKNQGPQQLFPSQASLTMIEALSLDIPYKSTNVCKVLPESNQCNVKEIQFSIRIQGLSFVSFLLFIQLFLLVK